MGRELAGRIKSIQNRPTLAISTVIRISLLILLMLTNCQPRHNLNVYFSADWIYICKFCLSFHRNHMDHGIFSTDRSVGTDKWSECISRFHLWLLDCATEKCATSGSIFNDLPNVWSDAWSMFIISCYSCCINTDIISTSFSSFAC